MDVFPEFAHFEGRFFADDAEPTVHIVVRRELLAPFEGDSAALTALVYRAMNSFIEVFGLRSIEPREPWAGSGGNRRAHRMFDTWGCVFYSEEEWSEDHFSRAEVAAALEQAAGAGHECAAPA